MITRKNNIGTNVALYVGHGALREHVMGRVQREATTEELTQMSELLDAAMQAEALGLSTGLYYVPGSYANTANIRRRGGSSSLVITAFKARL